VTHVELFAGTGGISIAAEWAGFRTVAQVERDPYCLKVLEKHWPGVHRCREIRDFPDQDYGAVTLVSGGPPCQPASTAGKRGGREDDRWLWPEFARIVECLLPAWVLAENPLGILSLENGLAIEEWIARLEAKDYAFLPPLVYPIAALGADHRRYRVFFVAHIDNDGFDRQKKDASKPSGDKQKDGLSERNVVAHLDGIGRGQCGRTECESLDAEQDSKNAAHSDGQFLRHQSGGKSRASRQDTAIATNNCEVAADVDGKHSDVSGYGTSEVCGERSNAAQIQRSEITSHPSSGGWIEGDKNAGGCGERENTEKAGSGPAYCSWWDTRSRLLRMVHGVRRRMDGRRIKALGNSCSPQQVYPILQAIAEVEER